MLNMEKVYVISHFYAEFNKAARNVSRNMSYDFFPHKIIEAGVLRQSKDLGVPRSYSEQVSYSWAYFHLVTVNKDRE